MPRLAPLRRISVTFSHVFKGIRADWRTDRARLVWFLAHAAALAILMAITDFGRGSVFLIGGSVIAASYGIGYVVLTIRAVRRESSSSNRQE